MSLIVLDASVAVKWFLPKSQETLVEEALNSSNGTYEARLNPLGYGAQCLRLFIYRARYDAEMITADERLANSVAARLPVKWLGA